MDLMPLLTTTEVGRRGCVGRKINARTQVSLIHLMCANIPVLHDGIAVNTMRHHRKALKKKCSMSKANKLKCT